MRATGRARASPKYISAPSATHKPRRARRRVAQKQKVPKDIAQAEALIEALAAYDPDALGAAIAAAVARGGDLKAVALNVERRVLMKHVLLAPVSGMPE